MTLARLLSLALLVAALPAQRAITTPKEFLGQQVGADRFLADYTQLSGYWRLLAAESDRMVLVEIGRTSYGQPMLMAMISSPENLARRDRLRDISRRLCRAHGLDEEGARALAREGRAVIWIDAGMHATESVAAQNILELVYRMNARTDAETLRILDDVVLLVCPANPDGMEMIAKAYAATNRVGRIPVLYQRYVGHDNNRDFYMSSMAETEAINRVLYRSWYPQVVYNHHQSAPSGTIIFTPPFRDPFNYHVDPLVVRGIELVAAHMNARFAWEGKPGVISRSGASYSTWWNGGLRTTTYFHNMIGILTESFGTPAPTRITQRPGRRLPYHDYPMPVASQPWHARQTIEYLQTANLAILDLASRYREELLFNMYTMGRAAIERGSRDHWTPTPKLLAESERRAAARRKLDDEGGEAAAMPDAFTDPALRDARAYVLPRDQRDGAAARRFIGVLQKCGVEVHRATADFEAGGQRHPAGSWVVFAAQAFRAHVMDMFEPQWHPDDVGPNGEPVGPYDSAGWTPAISMGVQFVRALDELAGAFELMDGPPAAPPAVMTDGAAGWLATHTDGSSYVVTNRLLAAGDDVSWLSREWSHGGEVYPPGTVFVRAGEGTAARLAPLAAKLGLDFVGVDVAPDVDRLELRAPRVGLFDVYGGDMSTGWTRWTLERFEFDVETVHGARVHEGGLRDDFDVLIFHAGLPTPLGDGQRVQRALRRGRPSQVASDDLEALAAALPPFEDWSDLAARRVRLAAEETIPALREFVTKGGTLVALGQQTGKLIRHFDLPIDVGTYVEGESGERRRTKRTEFFIPTSLVRATVDDEHVLGYGVPRHLSLFFRRSPVFQVQDDSVQVVARYASEDILASGWAVGSEFIAGHAAVLATKMGDGAVYLYGADVVFRGQPDASIKLLLNGLLAGPAR